MTAPERAREVIDWVVDIRRDIHTHPELSMHEIRTAALVAEKLTEMGIETHRIGEIGVVGILQGGEPGKVLALRADMDALPLHEQTDLPFKSRNPGVMHVCACGAGDGGRIPDRWRGGLRHSRRRDEPGAVDCGIQCVCHRSGFRSGGHFGRTGLDERQEAIYLRHACSSGRRCVGAAGLCARRGSLRFSQ